MVGLKNLYLPANHDYLNKNLTLSANHVEQCAESQSSCKL